jgi:hypothetical protein
MFFLILNTWLNQGAAENKIGSPCGEWVGQRPKKDQGQINTFRCFLWCFRTPLAEKRPKSDKKNKGTQQIEEKTKNFDMDFL